MWSACCIFTLSFICVASCGLLGPDWFLVIELYVLPTVHVYCMNFHPKLVMAEWYLSPAYRHLSAVDSQHGNTALCGILSFKVFWWNFKHDWQSHVPHRHSTSSSALCIDIHKDLRSSRSFCSQFVNWFSSVSMCCQVSPRNWNEFNSIELSVSSNRIASNWRAFVFDRSLRSIKLCDNYLDQENIVLIMKIILQYAKNICLVHLIDNEVCGFKHPSSKVCM